MTKSKTIKEGVKALKEQGFPVYVGKWMPCPVCKAPWHFHKADKRETGKPPVLLCPIIKPL